MSVKNEYEQFVDGVSSSDWLQFRRRYSQLFSLSYFQASFKNLRSSLSGQNLPVSTEIPANKNLTKLMDGSIVYGEVTRNATNDEIDQRVEDFIRDKVYGLETSESFLPNQLSYYKC